MGRLLKQFAFIGCLVMSALSMHAQDQSALQQEESQDYFRKWLTEDVVYIVTGEEKAVFENLTTDEERERFIEQFWIRRDPDLSTSINEYKEEHYRRIAYANENFQAGMEGWRTDRGKIYIIHGAPDQLTSRSAGETYNRPMSEGGGTTNTYPFEVWRYRHIPGIGDDVELEFVDRSLSGAYKLVFSPWEKDLLLTINNAGQTQAEELGMARREDHPFYNWDRTNIEAYPFMYHRAKDDPFVRYELFNAVQRPKELKYQDLKQMVEVNVDYEGLDFSFENGFFQLNEQQLLMPMTLEWDNPNLTFVEEEGVWVARLGVYGIVRSMSKRVVSEFEDDVVVRLTGDQAGRRLNGKSVFQKSVVLDKGNRYKLDLIVKDLHSGKIGTRTTGLVPPKVDLESLTSSEIVLSDYIRKLGQDSYMDSNMFVLGDLWIRPSLDGAFPTGQDIGAYMHLYNVGFDQNTLLPSLQIHYTIVKDGQVITDETDTKGTTIHYVSQSRTVLLPVFKTSRFGAGSYSLTIEVKDLVKNESTSSKKVFRLQEKVVPRTEASEG